MTVRSGPLWLRYCEPGPTDSARVDVGAPGRRVGEQWVGERQSADQRAANQRRVAYALGKGLGSAVVRNRLRRQLRAVFEECAGGADAGFFPAGDYLVGIWPSPEAKGTTATERKRIHNWSYGELSQYVQRALGKLERKAAHGDAGNDESGRGEQARGNPVHESGR